MITLIYSALILCLFVVGIMELVCRAWVVMVCGGGGGGGC